MTGKRLTIEWLVSAVLVFLLSNFCPLYAANVIQPGTTLPSFKMKAPDSPESCKYLGIQNKKKFSLSDISAKLVIVEFFNVFCPVCHTQAPKANQIYKLIEGNPELRSNVKMIAIGVSSNAKQIATYKEKFNVIFPLIPDPDGNIMTTARISSVPQTLIVDKNGKVLSSHIGIIDNLDDFLIDIKKHL